MLCRIRHPIQLLSTSRFCRISTCKRWMKSVKFAFSNLVGTSSSAKVAPDSVAARTLPCWSYATCSFIFESSHQKLGVLTALRVKYVGLESCSKFIYNCFISIYLRQINLYSHRLLQYHQSYCFVMSPQFPLTYQTIYCMVLEIYFTKVKHVISYAALG